MKTFKDLLLENEQAKKKETKLGHLPHLHRLLNIHTKDQNTEEEQSYGGHRGVETTDEFLNKFHDFLRGKNVPNKYTFSEKMEGAPSFLARKYGGVTSVAYKGAAGKPDQMVSTHEDIDRAYGHAPGLADKMHKLLDHIGKILPDSQKIYQGDFMGDEESVQQEGDFKTAQQNSMKYHFPSDTNLGKIMVSLHTMYDRGGAKPIDRKTRASFIQHPDVYHMDPTINVNPANYTPEEQAAFAHHMTQANEAYKRIKPEDEEFLRRHGDDLETFINRSIRQNIEPSHENYIAHLNERSAQRVAKLKSEKGRTAESLKHSDRIRDAVENKKVFENAIKMSMAHQAAGDVLRKVAAKNTKHMTSIDGEASEGEGVVVSRGNSDGTTTMAKIANPGFTAYNLRGGGNISKAKETSQLNKEQTNLSDYLIEMYAGRTKYKPVHHSFRRSVHIEPRVGEKQIPIRTSVAAARNQHQQFAARSRNKVAVREETEDNTKRVLSYVRMNPIHEGHRTVVNAGVDEAKRQGAEYNLILSHSHDAKKNPLSPEQKLKHARRAFPGVNISVSTPEHPTLLHHISKAYSEGVRHLTIVGGSDRDAFAGLAEKYKGVKGKHGYYGKDMNIKFVQAGEERDESSGGVSSFSASEMRKAASNNDRESFHKMAPKNMSPKHIDEMMQDVQAGMRG